MLSSKSRNAPRRVTARIQGVASRALRHVKLLSLGMKAWISFGESLDGKSRQVGGQIIHRLNWLHCGVSKRPAHGCAVALFAGEILNLFTQVRETLSRERRHGRKGIPGALLSMTADAFALVERLAARLGNRYGLNGRGRLAARQSRGDR